MPSNPSSNRSPGRSGGLLLRVLYSDGQLDEIYLAPNLSIGRSVANVIVLNDDAEVDLHHAKVELAADGSPLLRCVDPTARLSADGAAVWELPLGDGVRFSIGRTSFECVSAGGRSAPAPSGIACPLCGSSSIDATGDKPTPCGSCGEPLLPIHTDPSSRETIILPARYGEYQAERYVARGGMGLVLRGSRRTSGEKVAIKVIPPSPNSDRRDAERFRREAEAMSRIRHPNVVGLLDFDEQGGFGYLILEWVAGPSLRDRINRAGYDGELIAFDVAMRWFDQVCKGLAAIHSAGLIHRDIKPSNILTTPEGVARIADFGIARSTDAGRTASTTAHAPGTYAYMAPEQLTGAGPVDHRADLYALGATFYEVLTGSTPLGAWRPASEINVTVPESFDAVLTRLLAAKPADRYGSANEPADATELLKEFQVDIAPLPYSVDKFNDDIDLATQPSEVFKLEEQNHGESPPGSQPTSSEGPAGSTNREPRGASVPEGWIDEEEDRSSETPSSSVSSIIAPEPLRGPTTKRRVSAGRRFVRYLFGFLSGIILFIATYQHMQIHDIIIPLFDTSGGSEGRSRKDQKRELKSPDEIEAEVKAAEKARLKSYRGLNPQSTPAGRHTIAPNKAHMNGLGTPERIEEEVRAAERARLKALKPWWNWW